MSTKFPHLLRLDYVASLNFSMPWPLLWLLVFANKSGGQLLKNNFSMKLDNISLFSTISDVDEFIDECVDIKEYLWNETSDYTSLPSTMSFFAAIYSLIVT